MHRQNNGIFKMMFFKKKVTEEEFQTFEKQVRKSFMKFRRENRVLENRLEVLTKVTMSLCPLSKQFTELQHQFTELVKQFSNDSLNRPEQKKEIPIEPHDHPKEDSSGLTENQSGHLTQLEQKGLVFVGKLQNEAGSQMIPVGILTENLYPAMVNQKIKTTVSNILSKNIELGLIHRERQGNHWYVGLTFKGYKAINQLLHQKQLKNLILLYEKK
jgi:hypothetical protein